MKFTLTQVQHVLALGRFRHFGRAAEHLEITQPALSRSIKSLEGRLGCSLFDRSRNGVMPTREGTHLLERGHELLTAAIQLQAELGPLPGSIRDELGLACGLFPAEMTLPPILQRLTAELPGLELGIEITDWTQARALLDSGKSQLMFGEIGPAAGFESRVVNQQPLHVIVRPDHPLTRKPAPDARGVFAYPWVCSRIPPRAVAPFVQGGAKGRLDEKTGWFTPSVVSTSLTASLGLCRATDCVAVLPLSVAHPYLASGEVAIVPFHAPWLRLNYGLAWRSGEPLSRVAQRFIEVAEEEEAILQKRELQLARDFGCERWSAAALLEAAV